MPLQGLHVTVQSDDLATWVVAAATFLLAGITVTLAVAAWKVRDQLKLALRQLEEVKRDRGVQVFNDFGRRWESPEMTEALALEARFSARQLEAFFEAPWRPHSAIPWIETRRSAHERHRVVLLRVPNYFEDLAMVAKAGELEAHELFTGEFCTVAADEWDLWEPSVKAMQEKDADPSVYAEFERLAALGRAARVKAATGRPSERYSQ